MLEEWARRDALPAPEEIVAVRRLIRNAEAMLDGLVPAERASLDEPSASSAAPARTSTRRSRST